MKVAKLGDKAELCDTQYSGVVIRFVGLNVTVLLAEVAASLAVGLIVWSFGRRSV